jgi:hypothetical protein
MTQAEWLAEGERRFGPDKRAWVFVCPMCKTRQSALDFYRAGAKPGTGEVNKYLGFSCIGRFTNADPHVSGEPPGKGCDWTLGGLFSIHTLEVIDEAGKAHMHFEFGEPVPAQEVAA